MNPLNCPKCGRFLKDSCSTGHSNGIRYWDLNDGVCKVHGKQSWQS